MSLKLAHLQLLWGIAGARETFEDMVAQLIHVERPDSQRIRVVTGDSGLDSFEGGLTNSAGIDVYQMKYFPEKIGDAQKQQIRESFSTARDSAKFEVRSWTLCLPIDMSIDEMEWFEGWAQKQIGAAIDIRTPWGALHLEGLLLHEKNRAIRQAFFREESTELLRAMGTQLETILRELKERSGRSLQVQISPIWARNRLYAHIRLFNSGRGAIYIESWWARWGPKGREAGSDSVKTFEGKLPVRIEEHDATALLVEIDVEVESLTAIGVFDGDRHLWLAAEESLVMFKYNAIASRLPGSVPKQADASRLKEIKVEVTARATSTDGAPQERLEVVFKNASDKEVPMLRARLAWTYTPPRQMPNQPGKPSIEEAGGSVTLSALTKVNPISPGGEALFVLDEDMSAILVELTRGDVRDEDILIEFATDRGVGWKASMDEIPSAVRAVANTVLATMRQSR